MAEADPMIVDEAETAPPARTGRRKHRIAMIAVPLFLVIGASLYWWSLIGKVSTDNAYVKFDKVSIAPEVSGPLVEVFARENDFVKKGQLLFRVDPEPYEVSLAQADAAMAMAQSDVTALSNDAALSGAEIAAAHEDIAFARTTLARQKALWERGFTTKADYDAARHAVAQAQDALRLAEAEQREAKAKLARGAAVPGEDPRIAEAKARRRDAELNIRRTEVRAPVAGRVGEAERLHPGQMMIEAIPVMTIVAENSAYVEANFKETQLHDMKIGQRAKVYFDAYPDLVIKGHVEAIGAGTGSEFSVLPAQNATGNWVKVTQRVPVRIALDEKSPRSLIAGLSAYVTVFTDGRER